jgi:hypothetical protein
MAENILTLSECPPQEWEETNVQKWRERARKLDELCTLAIICSLRNLDLSESPGQAHSQRSEIQPITALIDYCSARAGELGLEEEEDMNEYIMHDISKFQLHSLGMKNYRR